MRVAGVVHIVQIHGGGFMMKINAFRFVIIFVVCLYPAGVYAQTLFEDVASLAGLQGDSNLLQYGMAWGDYDNDGDDDLFVANDPANQLFRNNGDGTFGEVAGAAGIQDETLVAGGGVWGDYDGDGRLDLFVFNTSAEQAEAVIENRLFHNNGDGTFTNVAALAGVNGLEEPSHEEGEEEEEDNKASVGAVWADYDNDGDLDLMVCDRYRGPLLYGNHGDGTFLLVTEMAGLVLSEHNHEEGDEHEHHEAVGVEHAAWGDYDNDGDLDLYLSVAVAEVHEHEHETASLSQPHQEEEEVAETENRFFENNGDGTFSEKTDELGLGDVNTSMTHASLWGDYNNDGFLDLFVLNLGSFNLETAFPSRLFSNNGNKTFSEIGSAAGFDGEYYPLGGTWVDIDNDGFLDLSLINHPSHDDFAAGEFYRYPHPLFVSNGDGTFTNVNAEPADALLVTGITDINHAMGLAWSDYDNDGDLDFVLSENHGDGPLRLYQHIQDSGNHRMQIQLRRSDMNRFGIGARVVVTSSQGTQTRQMGVGNDSFASQSSLSLHFGLGADTEAGAVVYWPDGRWENFGALSAGRRHVLTAGSGLTTPVVNWELQ